MANERQFVSGDRRYRRYPQTDPCRVNMRRLSRLSERALWNIWVRLGASATATTVQGLLKGYVSNLATLKSIKGNSQQDRHARYVYGKIAGRAAKEFIAERGKWCTLRRRRR
jgi:hypothetical protein